MLSQNSTYTTYMVFKISDESYGLDSPLQEAAVIIGENKLTRQVCLQGHENEGEDEEGCLRITDLLWFQTSDEG